MKKRLTVLLAVLFICLLAAVPACAGEPTDMHFFDYTGRVGDQEWMELENRLSLVSSKLGANIAVLIYPFEYMESDEYYMAFADDAYDTFYCPDGPIEGDRGYDGVLYLVAIDGGERPYKYISTCGRVIDAINADALDYLLDETEDAMNSGDYYSGTMKFAELMDSIVTDYDNGITFKKPYELFIWLLIAFGLSFITAEIMCAYHKSQLKSVALQAAAQDYTREGSFNLTEQRDIFLYKTVTRTVRETSSSSGSGTHHSSSGISHGGGGRR